VPRKNDDKMDIGSIDDPYDRKMEARFTKQARATMTQKGELDPDKIDDTHRTDDGPHPF
jgi:hypothetical protein